MVTNDLGACEWFVWDLRRSALIDRGQLDQIVSEFLKRNPRAEAPALADYLVQQGTLTGFQAERILNSKSAGLVLGPYILMDAIGTGSMGQVFKASSKNDNAHYAVKVLPRRSMWNVRLARRQVRSFSQFSHPAVVPFVDVGTAGGLHFLAWPLVEGQTLEYMVTQHGRLPAGQSAQIGVQIAQGMHAAHANSIFHGLLKPSNVMLGSDNQARILDFGIGSLLVENEGESLVDTMSTANTLTSGLDCSAPESVMDPTNRTPSGDQYSLGCTLYFCLTGRVPFPEGSAVEKMMAHQSKMPPDILDFAPECPDGLIQVVLRLMEKKPEDRFTGMDEVVEALEPYLGEYAVETPALVGAGAKGGSRGRMNSVGTGTSRPGGGRSSFAPVSSAPVSSAPVQTPPPARSAGGLPPTRGPAQRPAAPSMPAMRGQPPSPPAPPRNPTLPGRQSIQQPPQPQQEEEVPLTTATPPNEFPDAAKLSTNWSKGDPDARPSAAFGTAGLAAAALTLAVLVYLGVKLLVLDQ
jgi:serine/threonine-protein kinase